MGTYLFSFAKEKECIEIRFISSVQLIDNVPIKILCEEKLEAIISKVLRKK